MTDIFDAGSDDEAIAGEHVGYVPCTDEAFPPDADDDSETIDGSDAGYVADGTEAGDFADSDDGQAVYGSAIGFVAKPCCGITDTFTRTVSGGWGISDSGAAWTLENGLASYVSVNGTSSVVSLPAASVGPGPQAIEKIPLSSIPSGYTHDFQFDYIHPTGNTSVWTRVIGTTDNHELGVAASISGSGAAVRSALVLNNAGFAYTDIDPAFWVVGTWYSLRYAYDGADHMARVWKTADPEPTSWTVTAPLTIDPPSGTLTLYAETQEANSSIWPATVTEWDNLCVNLT